jgi:hypothetical protein
MQPIQALQPNPVVNWSIPGQLIDQSPAAAVVINSLPFRGRIDHLPPSQPHRPHNLPTSIERSRAAVLGYAVAKPMESITRAKRHELTEPKLGLATIGGGDVLP